MELKHNAVKITTSIPYSVWIEIKEKGYTYSELVIAGLKYKSGGI